MEKPVQEKPQGGACFDLLLFYMSGVFFWGKMDLTHMACNTGTHIRASPSSLVDCLFIMVLVYYYL